MPTGSETLDHTPSNIFVNDEHVITFITDAVSGTGFQATLIPLDNLEPPTPGQPVDPHGLPYTPDAIEIASDGTLLLFSKPHESIFRWDPITESYGATIPLIGAPEFMAYSAETEIAYLAYASGLIRKIEFDSADPQELPFAVLPSSPMGLATAGSFVFAVDPSGAWVSHYTFAPDGSLVESVEWNYFSSEYIWSEVNQKMYFFRDGTSPNDLLWEEINADGVTYPGEPLGGIGKKDDSPLHGGGGTIHPIRVSPDGSVAVLGSGRIYDAQTLEPSPYALANSIADATWPGGELFTVRNIATVHQYQRWSSPTYGQAKIAQFPGDGFAVLPIAGSRLLGISIGDDGIPAFRMLNSNLEETPLTAFDFGDAPTSIQSGFASSYPTRIEDDGARHKVTGLYLGSRIDWEADGQPDDLAGANGGGDNAGVRDDEDGVRLLATIMTSTVDSPAFSLDITASATGKIDAWVDFNRDGDWLDPGEQIAISKSVEAGMNMIAASVPAGSSAGETAMRVRLSSIGGLSPTGPADDGEVEDYIVTILDGAAAGGVAVEITAPAPGTLDVVQGSVIVRTRDPDRVIFTASEGSVASISITGTDGDDTLNLENIPGVEVSGDALAGHDTLVLLGSDFYFDLTAIPDSAIQGIEAINITGSGDNSLTLDVNEVLNISPTSDTLRVQHDVGDSVSYGEGWAVGIPQIVDRQYLHVLTQVSATVQVVNTTPFHNPLRALDTNRDGSVSPLDALIIVNRLNSSGPGPLSTPLTVDGLTQFFYVDTNADLSVAPIDVIRVVNFLNGSTGGTEGEGTVFGATQFAIETPLRRAASSRFPIASMNLSPDHLIDANGIAVPRWASAVAPARIAATRTERLDYDFATALDELLGRDEAGLFDEFFE
ncbi:MAG: hypothetical protein H8E66_28280 [Planctomycetes bacterium]|nr:hypothetical protein [Planctomycetota bacterium]